MQSSITSGTNSNVSRASHEDSRKELIVGIFDSLYCLSYITNELSREVKKLTGLSRNQV
jgi:hypothetical protein